MQPILFSCWALDSLGAEVHSFIHAANKDEVVEKLKKMGLFSKKIEVLEDVRFEVPDKTKLRKSRIPFAELFKAKSLSSKTPMVFTRQLATLLRRVRA